MTSVEEVKTVIVVVECQSGEETGFSVTMKKDEQSQNVAFSDQVPSNMYDVDHVVDPTRMLQDSDDATLQNFFSRPIKIAEYEWSTSTTLTQNVNPWTAYFDNTKVRARMDNFNLFRAKMHVRILINGNGFQYGRLIAAYLPLTGFDSMTTASGPIKQDIVQLSQMPHLYLDPTTSMGGDMILPFFWHKNYLNYPERDYAQMGVLLLRTLNELKHANGASDVVTVSIYAWAEDVNMSVLSTVTPDSLTPSVADQSGVEGEIDEAAKSGTVSGPATVVAKFAGSLTKVPYIGPFAEATQLAANTTANIAKMFGYCRPPNIVDAMPLKPTPISSLAVTNVPDGVAKMTVDSKQELSIDPRIAGLDGIDSMSIKHMAMRESYLTSFTWSLGTTPETLLYNMRLDPCVWAETGTDPKGYLFPACAVAAMPFRYWTGTMRVRFQFVCSSFHKGRVRIVYDPNYIDEFDYNTSYSHVVDLADQTDFTIEVGNGQEYTLLEHAVVGRDSVTQLYSTSRYASKEPFSNGVLGVLVANELTTPSSDINNDIQVNVFVSMGDDFEVFVPNSTFQSFVVRPYEPPVQDQMGVELVTESQNTMQPSRPVQTNVIRLGPRKSNNDMINKVYTGEAITSFRTMLKRYNLWNTIGNHVGDQRLLTGRRNGFPFLRGRFNNGVHVTADNLEYNYCNTVLMHWLMWAHSGWRGSIRYKMLLRGRTDQYNRPEFYVQRAPPGPIGFILQNVTAPIASTASAAAETTVYEFNNTPRIFAGVCSGHDGQVYANGYVNPNLEFEVPFYSRFRFVPGKQIDYTSDITWSDGYDYRITLDGNPSTFLDMHVAAGEDFQYYFFTGMPRLYFEYNPPAV